MSYPKPYFSIPEICEILQICPATLHKLFNSKRLERFKVGRRTFVTEDELKRFTKNKNDE